MFRRRKIDFYLHISSYLKRGFLTLFRPYQIRHCIERWCPTVPHLQIPNPPAILSPSMNSGRSSHSGPSARHLDEYHYSERYAQSSRASFEDISEADSPIKRYQEEHPSCDPFIFDAAMPNQVEDINDVDREPQSEHSGDVNRRRRRPTGNARSNVHNAEIEELSLDGKSLVIDEEDILQEFATCYQFDYPSPFYPSIHPSAHSHHHNIGTYGIDTAFPEAQTPEERFLASSSTAPLPHSSSSDSDSYSLSAQAEYLEPSSDQDDDPRAFTAESLQDL